MLVLEAILIQALQDKLAIASINFYRLTYTQRQDKILITFIYFIFCVWIYKKDSHTHTHTCLILSVKY